MRYIQVLIFTAVYIALGFLLKSFDFDVNFYLLIGIPLSILFQLFVRKQPLHRAWMRDEDKLSVDLLSVLMGIGFAVYPVYRCVMMINNDRINVALMSYYLVSIAGAFGAGYAFSKLTKKTVRDLLLCLLVAGGIGCTLMFLAAIGTSYVKHTSFHFNTLNAIASLLTYIPVTFVMEEVVFRGILDAHVHPPGAKKGFLSAFFVSALWGLWHLPTLPPDSPLLTSSISMIVVHSLTGIPFSFFWRRTGNLAVPAFTHAFIDAIRNALLKP